MKITGCMAALAYALAAQAQGGAGLPSCPAEPLYRVIPMALTDFLAFRPLGFVSLPSNAFPVKHSSFSIALPGEPTPERLVLFPGDLWVTEIWSYRSANFGGYQLYFQPCAQVRGYFFHLKDISARLKETFQAVRAECQDYPDPSGIIVKCRAQVMVRVAAGEPAGVSGDGAGVDFGMADFRIRPSGLAVPEHYPSDYPYYVSPVDYYPDEVKALFAAKLASWDGTVARTADPRVGSYRPDLPGTAQGLWFVPGTNMRNNPADMTGNLALVNDYVDPGQPILMLGTSVRGVPLGLYSFTPSAARPPGRNRRPPPRGSVPDSALDVNREFREVTADGRVYCYENLRGGRSKGLMPLTNLNGILLVTLPDASSLRIEKQGSPGATCDAMRPWTMSANSTTFER